MNKKKNQMKWTLKRIQYAGVKNTLNSRVYFSSFFSKKKCKILVNLVLK